MKIFCVVGVLCASILSSYGHIYAAEKEASQIPTVTLRLLDVRVDEIIKDISKQVGYTVQVEGEARDEVVSGRYKDVPLDQFLQRIFKHKNVAIDIDTNEKKVIVHMFDSSLGGKYVKVQAKGAPDSKLAFSNVTLSELEDIFAEEEAIYQAWKEDPNAIIPLSGITKSEFNEIIDQEAENYEEQKLDPERQVALTSLTHAEVTSILEHEGKEEQARRQDPNEKIALSNMTQSEYKMRIKEEGRKNQQAMNDPNALIPFSNVKNSEFHAMVKE